MKPLFLTGDTLIHKNSKKGFMTVEAAIFLPLFIVGVLTLAYLIKFMSIQESVFHAFTDEARVLSSEASINPFAPSNFESKLKSRIYEENGNNLSEVDIDNFQYLYSYGKPGMISMDLNYDVNLNLPIQFYSKLPVSDSLIIRGFIGMKMDDDPMPFEEMEKETESELVWIFPRSGERYHKENCTYITSKPKEVIMSKYIRNHYKPCTICNSKQLKNGELTYYFSRYGGAYHTEDCPTIDKYIISIEKDEAVREGYQPCTKCGGE